MYGLMHKHVMGRLSGISNVIEYQKRMLPYAQIVFIIHPDNRHKASEDIGKVVSAEIPRKPTAADNEETRESLIRTRTACHIWLVVHVVQRIPVSQVQPEIPTHSKPF
jgi:hypothetical protein